MLKNLLITYVVVMTTLIENLKIWKQKAFEMAPMAVKQAMN